MTTRRNPLLGHHCKAQRLIVYITVYRKPTHTDQYLQWDSHHNLSAKFGVINTLSRMPKQCAAILTAQTRKRTSGRLSLNASIPMGFG